MKSGADVIHHQSSRKSQETEKKHKIQYELIDPKKRKVVKKSYADNFLR